jgi:hypothetical protein
MTDPEWSCLHSALETLHSRILYDELGIEHIGYSNELFKRSGLEPANRTLADRLCWCLGHGDRLQAVKISGGRFVGPTLTKEQLRERWLGLDPDAREPGPHDESGAVRALRGLFALGTGSVWES